MPVSPAFFACKSKDTSYWFDKGRVLRYIVFKKTQLLNLMHSKHENRTKESLVKFPFKDNHSNDSRAILRSLILGVHIQNQMYAKSKFYSTYKGVNLPGSYNDTEAIYCIQLGIHGFWYNDYGNIPNGEVMISHPERHLKLWRIYDTEESKEYEAYNYAIEKCKK